MQTVILALAAFNNQGEAEIEKVIMTSLFLCKILKLGREKFVRN